MKKVLIIEDEYYSALRLKKLISDIDDTVEVVGPLQTIDEVTSELIRNNDYDLIFSDIRLSDGDVFDAFRKVKPKSFVIFTTAYNEYSMQAIKNNGLDYLMKPIDFKELCSAVEKLKLGNYVDEYQKLENILSETHKYRERFLVSKGDELKTLYVDKINFIRKEDSRVEAVTNDGSTYSLALSMSDIEQELDPDKFFRINRQYIANIRAIQKISLFFGSKLIVRLKRVLRQ